MRIHWVVCGFIILLLGSLLALPWIDGVLFEKKYRDLLTSFSVNTPINIQILDYKQSWLSSETTLRLEYVNKNAKYPSVTITQVIKHGPLIHNPDTQQWGFAYGFILSTAKVNQASFPATMQASTLINLNEDFVTQFSIQDSFISLPTKEKISWKGIKGTTTVNKEHLDHLQANLQMDQWVDELDSTNSLTASGITYEGDFTQETPHQWRVNGSLHMPTILLNYNKTKTTIQDLKSQTAFDWINFEKVNKIQATITMGSFTSNSPAGNSISITGINSKDELSQKANNLWTVNSTIAAPRVSMVDSALDKIEITQVNTKITAVETDFKKQGSYKVAINLDNLLASFSPNVSINVKGLSSQIAAALLANGSLNIDNSYGVPEVSFSVPNLQFSGLVQRMKGASHVVLDLASNDLKYNYEMSNDQFSMTFYGFKDGEAVGSFTCKNSTDKGSALVKQKINNHTNTFSMGEVSFDTLSAMNGKISNFKIVSSYDKDSNELYNKKMGITFDDLTLLNYSYGAGNIDFAIKSLQLSSDVSLKDMKNNLKGLPQESAALIFVTPQTKLNGVASLKSADGILSSKLNIFWKTDAPIGFRDPKFMKSLDLHFNFQLPITIFDKFIASLKSSSIVDKGQDPEAHFESVINKLSDNYQVTTDVAGLLLYDAKQSMPSFLFNLEVNKQLLRQVLSPQQATMIKVEYARVYRGHLAEILPTLMLTEVQAGDFKMDQKNYLFDFSYEDGITKINGIDTSLPAKKPSATKPETAKPSTGTSQHH